MRLARRINERGDSPDKVVLTLYLCTLGFEAKSYEQSFDLTQVRSLFVQLAPQRPKIVSAAVVQGERSNHRLGALLIVRRMKFPDFR
jgi:hypothetical protein